MSPRPSEEDWDLSPVINLIYSLSNVGETQTQVERWQSPRRPSLERPHIPVISENLSKQATKLGNFDKIWKHLGQPIDLLPPDVPPAPKGEYIEIFTGNGHDYAAPLKAVKWRDELEGADLADNDEKYETRNLPDLSKKQRKKERRKQRQKDRAEALVNGHRATSGSEDESEKDVQAPHTPDRKAIIDEILYGSPKTGILPGIKRYEKASRAEPVKETESWPVASPHSASNPVQILKPQRESAFAIAAAKKARLITMLTERFVDERQYLNNISFIKNVKSSTDNPPEGIHVFVDASNVRFTPFVHGLLPSLLAVLLTNVIRS